MLFRSPGYILFLREDTLMGQRFDTDKMVLSGEPFTVAEHIGIDPLSGGRAGYTVSQTGMLAYMPGGGSTNRQLFWMDRSGKIEETLTSPGTYENPKVSPEGKRLAFFKADNPAGDIWIMDLERKSSSRLTFDPGIDNYPLWAPDGNRIVFASNREGIFNLYQKSSAGTGSDELLLKTPNNKVPLDWSTDGRYILYQENDPKTADDLWVLPLSGDRKPIPFLATAFDEDYEIGRAHV